MGDSLLVEIINDTLEAVTFTGSGVKLDFGNAWFTIHGWPNVSVGSEIWAFGDRGYRDALCALISQTVTDVADTPGHGVASTFALGELTSRFAEPVRGRSRVHPGRDRIGRSSAGARDPRHDRLSRLCGLDKVIL